MPKQKNEVEQQTQKGFSPLKVKKYISGVASAGHAALLEAKSIRQPNPVCQMQQHSKPPILVSPPSKSKEVCLKKKTATKDSKRQHKIRPATPTASPSVSLDLRKDIIEQPVLHYFDNDWEILSTDEKMSTYSGVVVPSPRAGSVRSITSLDRDSSSQSTISVPFKIQRTDSSSTLDSQDNVLGPSGKVILGVDYVDHVCLPNDTIQAIRIAHKVSASQLRHANRFSGTLHPAPKKLLIPLSKQALRTGIASVEDTDAKEYKLHYFQAVYPDKSVTEAKVYLELADWGLKDALKAAKEDLEWESGGDCDYESDEMKSLKSGQIDINVGFTGKIPTFNLIGIGHSSSSKFSTMKNRMDRNDKTERIPETDRIVVHSRPPAIATKNVLAEDLYNAAPQHDSYGFELKNLSKSNESAG